MAIARIPPPEERTAAALESIARSLVLIQHYLCSAEQTGGSGVADHQHSIIEDELAALHELVQPSVR